MVGSACNLSPSLCDSLDRELTVFYLLASEARLRGGNTAVTVEGERGPYVAIFGLSFIRRRQS